MASCQLYVYKVVLSPQCTAQLATDAGLVQKRTILLQLGQTEVGSCSYHERTLPEVVCNLTKQVSICLFWATLRSIIVLTATQTNRTKGENKPEFSYTKLNKSGVKTICLPIIIHCHKL